MVAVGVVLFSPVAQAVISVYRHSFQGIGVSFLRILEKQVCDLFLSFTSRAISENEIYQAMIDQFWTILGSMCFYVVRLTLSKTSYETLAY